MSNLYKNIEKDFLTKTKHYKIFYEHPFLPHERERTTILLGGFTNRHDYLIQSSIEGLGYKVQHLPTPDIQAYHTGREYCNNGMCNPAYFTIGNLLSFLKNLKKMGLSTDEILKNYVFLTAGACGPCRFGMYENEYRMALRNAGFEGFRVLVFQQVKGMKQSDTNSGLVMNEEFFLGIIKSIIFADLLNDTSYKIRPYEIKPGEVDLILSELTQSIVTNIKKEQSFLKGYFLRHDFGNFKLHYLIIRELILNRYKQLIKETRKKLKQIEVDNLRLVPVVKITGEFWAQTTEGDGNFKMFKYLQNEGAEVIIEPITNWLLYLLFDANQYITDRKKIKPKFDLSYYKNFALIKISEKLLNYIYNKYRKCLLNIPEKLGNQYLLGDLADKYYNNHAKGGEGHLEVAKSIYYTKYHLAHMILSVKPFGCLPSTQSDGVHALVTVDYPEMVFLPIETSVEGEINAYSRIQMALSDARQKCNLEFEEALNNTKLSVDKIQTFLKDNPEYCRVGMKIPRTKGVISRAANFVYFMKKILK